MLLIERCPCGATETTTTAWRLEESYEVDGECLDCQDMRERKAAADAYVEERKNATD